MAPVTLTDSNNEDSNKQPWWIGPLYKFGIPSTIAIGLVWFLATQVREGINRIETSLNAHQYSTQLNLDTYKESNQINRDILRLLQRICINSATTNQERSECFQ